MQRLAIISPHEVVGKAGARRLALDIIRLLRQSPHDVELDWSSIVSLSESGACALLLILYSEAGPDWPSRVVFANTSESVKSTLGSALDYLQGRHLVPS